MIKTLNNNNFKIGMDHLFKVEERFKPFQDALKEVSFEKRDLNFWALVKVIIGQQLSGKAADTIANRVLDIDTRIQDPEMFRSLDLEVLRSCGISNQKVGFLLGIANMLSQNPGYFEDLKNLNGEEMQQEFVKIKGIGPWSATILTIFYAGQPDVLIPGDVTINKVVTHLFGVEVDEKSKVLVDLLDHWRPYRSVGCVLCYEIFDRKLLM